MVWLVGCVVITGASAAAACVTRDPRDVCAMLAGGGQIKGVGPRRERLFAGSLTVTEDAPVAQRCCWKSGQSGRGPEPTASGATTTTRRCTEPPEAGNTEGVDVKRVISVC